MHGTHRRTPVRRWLLALAFVGVILLAGGIRWGLVASSYAAHAHWEEPVFLLSAVHLAQLGLGAVWDYQDDLSHGGSVPLLILATWSVRVFGPSMLVLKAIAVAWACAAVAFLVAAVARCWSPGAALLFALLLLCLDPNLARLQATLVGSHPEALLPAAIALWVFAGSVGAPAPQSVAVFALGLAAAAAAWMSLTFAPWMAVLGGCGWWLARRAHRARTVRAWFVAGVGLGLTPWAYQNLYLRPHGALLWAQRLQGPSSELLGNSPHSRWGTLTYLSDSWGLEQSGLGLSLGAGLAALGLLGMVIRDPLLSRTQRCFAASLLASALLTAGSLWASSLGPQGNEGYYFARFFVALHVQMLLLAALVLDQVARRTSAWLQAVVAIGMLAIGAAALLPLFGSGGEPPPLDVLLRRGCLVFGNAELQRAGDPQRALARVVSLTEPGCRDMACTGLGWALADDYLARGSAAAAQRALEWEGAAACKKRLCGGMRFVLARRGSPARAGWLPREVETLCQ